MAEIRGYKVVFEGDGWSILEDKPELSYSTKSLMASHVNCEAKDDEGVENRENAGRAGIMSWFSNEEYAICYYCGVPVPDGIQALIHLSSSF